MWFEKSSYKFMTAAHTSFNNTAILKRVSFAGKNQVNNGLMFICTNNHKTS